jgi:hypothetical protein
MLPVLYGCGTWSLALNRNMGWGIRTEELTGGWRKLHNEELHNLNPSSNIIQVIKLRW